MAHRTLVQVVQYRLDGLDCGWTAFDVEGQVFVSDAGGSTSTAYPVKFAVRLFRCDPTCLGFIKDKGPAALDVPVSYSPRQQHGLRAEQSPFFLNSF